MIRLARKDYEGIIEYVKRGLPNEACGLLAGDIIGEEVWIRKVYYLTNVDASNEHFRVDPKEQLEAIKDIRSKQLQLIGNFHSHPETPARPSEEDKRLAYDSNLVYAIVSLEESEPVLKAFHIEGKKDVTILPIRIVE